MHRAMLINGVKTMVRVATKISYPRRRLVEPISV
jgi:hypothetical protein